MLMFCLEDWEGTWVPWTSPSWLRHCHLVGSLVWSDDTSLC